MNSIAKQACNFLKNSNTTSSLHGKQQQFQQLRGIQVSVRNNNLDQALTLMERRMRQSGMERLIKSYSMRTHHIKNSEKRILAQKGLQRKLKSQDLARKLQSILIKKVRGI
ncbi:Ribosomal protein s21 family protein [Thalictrum thalictroides]|uniref:Ribosomal protein s21 family protein n=1 Tax=Thalictrum thalictroides TaxID=46969 RepID=A0A7J6XAQ6_THATH|nr:Ribosomal protein s21 family protein [Thalictrum thalictroides]